MKIVECRVIRNTDINIFNLELSNTINDFIEKGLEVKLTNDAIMNSNHSQLNTINVMYTQITVLGLK